MATSKNPFLIQNSTAGRSYGSARSLAAPLFLIHDASGNILSYLKLGFLGDARKVYGISDPHFGHEGGSWLSVDQLARHYIKLVKKVMLRGDILLGGWSFGGIVAIQMAHMLAAEGRGLVCSGLILIDTIYLSPSRSLGSGANSNLAPSIPTNVTPDTRDEILVSLPGLVTAVIDTPGHHYALFADENWAIIFCLAIIVWALEAQRQACLYKPTMVLAAARTWSNIEPLVPDHVTAATDPLNYGYYVPEPIPYDIFSNVSLMEQRIAELEYANVATGVKANSQYGVYIDDSGRQQFLYPKITINNTEAYVISGLHQMHCMMEMLRDYGLLVNGFRPLWNDHHVIHCFNKWYRSIACSADSTAEGYMEPFGSVPMSEVRRASWASSVPRCRDFRALVRWAEDPERALPFHYDSGLNVTAVSRLSNECDLTKCRDEGGWKGLD
ncbi:hypothetical protein K4K49_000850 [Colletotrichum sp. SAR 10_70]|nr:hypothetical protein K4K49_000850 [Colletotrichum sp. SAR 10_70]KAJ5007516.1 hypothetical protein K4K48_012399 [Colletotrichum sp. SAR 10_66]